jgi:hypothetical protein
MNVSSAKRFTKLSIPLLCSCAPWSYWLVADAAVKQKDWEAALVYAALLGLASFLTTGPIAAAQLHLIALRAKLSFGTHLLLYSAVSAPTLTFQAFAISSSFLVGFVPGGDLTVNMPRTCVLTLLLGIVLYALVDLAFGILVRIISRRMS